MSWDIDLIDDRGHIEGDWNYTHNCNGMIEDAIGDAIALTPKPFWATLPTTSMGSGMGTGSWWHLLNGKTGDEGKAILDSILERLRGNPAKYRAMNPANGWGDYDRLVKVLTEMRDRVPAWPTRWEASG